ncbi:MAG: arabinogalactan endo-1,4-beta-galactosidase [Neolewinella sp.]|jgi:arabinogalactan endo-1,4-beta-galactosidase
MDDYPGKEVMVFETGYIWTNESNDSANNIISSVQEGYAPASPTNQKRWLIDLTQEMIQRGATGVIYWEPVWVSSSCRTQWGQGSHQEHATFFDFDNKLLGRYLRSGTAQWRSPPGRT